MTQRSAAAPCCLETIRLDALPFSLLADAYVDLQGGGERLRAAAFGITLTGERLDLPHYTQPKGLVYLRARLAVIAAWRNCPAPIGGDDIADGLAALTGWAEAAWYRENRGPIGDAFPRALHAKTPQKQG